MKHALAPDERRAHPRYAADFRARAFYGPGFGLWADCTITDVSKGGARLKVPALYPLPARFVVLHLESGLVYEVRLRWRRGDLTGVAFEKQHEITSTAVEAMGPIRKTWDALQGAR